MKLAGDAPLIRKAIASLQAGLPAQIAVFNAEAANQVDLLEPAVIHFGGTDSLSANAFPQLEVAAMDGLTGAFDLDRTEFDHDVAVNVVAWQECLTGEVSQAYEMALGYRRAVCEVLLVKDAFGAEVEVAQEGGLTWRIDVLPFEPTDDGREFRKWRVPTFLRFRLETVERFSS